MTDSDQPARSGLAAGTQDAWSRRDRVTWTLVGTVILAAVAVWVFTLIAGAFAPFVIGGLLAFLLRPIIGLLMRWKLSRSLAVLVTMLVIAVIFVAAVVVLLPNLGTEAQQFAANLPTYQAQVQAGVQQITKQFDALPKSTQGAAEALGQQAAAGFSAAMQQITSFILAAAGGLMGFGFNCFLGFIICIWLLLGGPEIAKWSLSVLPPAWREDARYLGVTFDRSFGGWIRGTVINVSITFLGCAVGFSLIGLPYAIALAAMVGLLDAIPFVGPIIGGIVCILVALTVSPTLAVLTLIVVLVVEQTVDSVISPIVMGDSVRLHPLGILLALGIGGALAGFFGVLVSIPVAAATYSAYLYFMRKSGVLEPAAVKPEKPKKGGRVQRTA